MSLSQWPIIKPLITLFHSRRFIILSLLLLEAVFAVQFPAFMPLFPYVAVASISLILGITAEDAAKYLATALKRGPLGIAADLINTVTNELAPSPIKDYLKLSDDALAGLMQELLAELQKRNMSKLATLSGTSTPFPTGPTPPPPST